MSLEISPALEDYLESILVIAAKNQKVRVKDLAESMQVRAPSALEALANLEARGLVQHEHYGGIKLSAKGRQRARKVYERHQSLKRFLILVLGLEDKLAEVDACRIEHYVSAKTISRIAAFNRFLGQCVHAKPVCLEKFLALRETKNLKCDCPVVKGK